MMKQGLQPTDTHAEAADKAAQTVPVDIQRAMLAEFHVKANFLLWATSPRNEVVWRQSPHFGKLPSSEVEEEMEEMEELYEDGAVHTTIVAWLRGNISAGIYPPTRHGAQRDQRLHRGTVRLRNQPDRSRPFRRLRQAEERVP